MRLPADAARQFDGTETVRPSFQRCPSLFGRSIRAAGASGQVRTAFARLSGHGDVREIAGIGMKYIH